MRGTLRSPRDRNANKRFIPARAGNSSIVRGSRTGRSVHPRACGELLLIISRVFHQNGSSPRVRGTPGDPDYECGLVRFIPARAGNSCSRQHRSSRHTVHPRACGELASRYRAIASFSGSSPRVRGTHSKRCAAADSDRFIPARAGNSASSVAEGSFVSVHPRACGELKPFTRRASNSCGSSPRVRGTHFPRIARYAERRFIPARAGNSVPFRWASVHPPVHPRACGELDRNPVAGSMMVGSSPRVRGTPELPHGHRRG